MILNEEKDTFKGVNPTVKTTFEKNKFQSYEPQNTCSPKNSFYLNSLNSSNLPTNKNELRSPVLSTEANNYNSQNASKLPNYFEKFTSDFIKGPNLHSNSKPKYNRGGKDFFDNSFNSQNTNPNINGYSSVNSQLAYKDLLIQQQENRFAKMKKERIMSLLDERPAAYEKNFKSFKNNFDNNNNFNNRDNAEGTLGKNYFSTSIYASQSKSPRNNLENSHFYNSIMHENPEIKKTIQLKNGNSNNKNGLSNKTNGYNIENFGLVPTSKNSSFNVLNNNNNNKKNAGKEFTEFLHASNNKQNKDFHHNFINSPLKNSLILNGSNPANRNSLKNLNVVKSQLENLFEKNDRKDKGYNNAMDNLCAFLNYKNKKVNGASVQHTDKSVKLMIEIKDMR